MRQGKVSSQTDAVVELEARGIEATQATVSRDLAEIGAVRHTRNGRAIYEIFDESQPPGASLSRVFRDYVLRRTASGQIVVLQTPPGHAGVVAAALDKVGIPGVIGVIAGDDTIFIACQEEIGAEAVLKRIETHV